MASDKSYATEQRLNSLIAALGAGALPADVTLRSVTSALSPVSGSLTIPAGTAIAGNTYTITARGAGSQGVSSQTPEWACVLGSIASPTVAFAGADLAPSAAFRWMAKAVATCIDVGATGHWFLSCDVIYTAFGGGNLTNALTYAATQFAGSQVQDTTADINMHISAGWSTVVSGQTFNGFVTSFGTD